MGFKVVRKVPSHYVSNDCLQQMLGYRDGVMIINSKGMIYEDTETDKYNSYLTILFTEKDNTITKCNSNSGLDNQSGNTNKVCQENVVLKNDAKLVAYAMKKTGHTK